MSTSLELIALELGAIRKLITVLIGIVIANSRPLSETYPRLQAAIDSVDRIDQTTDQGRINILRRRERTP